MYLPQSLLSGSCLLAIISTTLASALIPFPKGPYSTLITSSQLTDTTRLDPFASTNTSRSLMVSIYSPIPPSQCSKNLTTIPYMPSAVADFYDQTYSSYGIPAGTFGSLELQVCSQIHGKYVPRQYPILIFSPGLGDSRFEYGAILQSIASTGYIIISIDHPYDGSIVEFPNGSTILASNIETDEQIDFALSVRAQDVAFVLNQLSKTSVARELLGSLSCQLDVKNVGIFGHSLGGATALTAMVNNTRLSAGLNLDGSFFGPAISSTTKVSHPFLIIGHEGKNQSTDASWGAAWNVLRGWKLELEVLGAQHGSFTDLPLLVDVLGLGPYLPDGISELLGTMDGVRSLQIISAFVGGFFDMVLKGKESGILKKATSTYPEVVFVAKST